MTQPDPNAEVPSQLQAVIANMLDQLTSRPPQALLGQAYPDLNQQQQEKVWKDMLRNYAKDAAGGKFEAFELNKPHIQDDGDRAKRDEARRQLYEQIAAAHGHQLNWQGVKAAGTPDTGQPAAPQVTQQPPTSQVAAQPTTPTPQTSGAGQQPPTPPVAPPMAAGMPDDEEERRLRAKLRLKALREDPTYQRIYNTPIEDWTPEDLAVSGAVQAARLEMEANVGEWSTTRQGLKYAVEIEQDRNLPLAPSSMGQDRTPPPRNAWQRARMMAQEAGFIKPEQVPEAFQTDEWKAANAPLTQGERWQTAGDAAAVTAFAYLGKQGMTGMARFMSDEGTGQVLDDMGGMVSGGVGNIATGAAAGMKLGGPKGAAIGAVVGAAATIATLPQKIADWSQSLVDSRDKLMMWSGVLQAMKREAEIRGYARDIESGRETGAASVGLNAALQDLLDEIRPIKDEVFKITAGVLTAAARTTTELIPIAQTVWSYSRWLPPNLLYNVAYSALRWFGAWDDKPPDGTTVVKWADAWRNQPVTSARVSRR
jgi:hypothetical protein